MPRRNRLDTELVRRGMARSREHASELITAGCVRVLGNTAGKVATMVASDAPIVVRAPSDEPEWASRGAKKLLGALAEFGQEGLEVSGRRCLDAGASTGGFTDVLLHHGAQHVTAVDVGYGQLIWRLRNDPRVLTLDRMNVRHLSVDRLPAPADVVVADLSFISLRLVLPALHGCTHADSDLVMMVKPQFEVGKQRLGSGGVVRDPPLRSAAIVEVARCGAELGCGVRGISASPLPGPSGNVEFFVWLRRDQPVSPQRTLELAAAAAGAPPAGEQNR